MCFFRKKIDLHFISTAFIIVSLLYHNLTIFSTIFYEFLEVTLSNISNYLIKNGIDELYINLNEYNEEVQIGDRNIMEEIEKLTNKRYLVIEKNDNTIVFMRWSNLNSGRGFVYSINGSIPELQFLTYLKECSEPNWYYYEEDFNKWKSEHE